MSPVILCTSSYDMSIKFWEATSTQCYHSLPVQESQVNHMAITHKAPLHLAAATHRDIKLFHLASHTQTPLVGSFQGHRANVLDILFDENDEILISCSEDETIKMWDVRRTKLIKEIKCGAIVNSIALYPDQVTLIAAQENGIVSLWNIEDDVKKLTEVKLDAPVRSVSVSPEGDYVICGTNSGKVHIFHIVGETMDASSTDSSSLDLPPQIENISLQLVKVIQAHERYILKVLISPDADIFATTSADRIVKIWSLSQESPEHLFKNIQTLKGHKKWIWDCAFSSDSAYLVTASSDGTAKLWDVLKGEAIKTYKGHQKAVVSVFLHDQPPQ